MAKRDRTSSETLIEQGDVRQSLWQQIENFSSGSSTNKRRSVRELFKKLWDVADVDDLPRLVAYLTAHGSESDLSTHIMIGLVFEKIMVANHFQESQFLLYKVQLEKIKDASLDYLNNNQGNRAKFTEDPNIPRAVTKDQGWGIAENAIKFLKFFPFQSNEVDEALLGFEQSGVSAFPLRIPRAKKLVCKAIAERKKKGRWSIGRNTANRGKLNELDKPPSNIGYSDPFDQRSHEREADSVLAVEAIARDFESASARLLEVLEPGRKNSASVERLNSLRSELIRAALSITQELKGKSFAVTDQSLRAALDALDLTKPSVQLVEALKLSIRDVLPEVLGNFRSRMNSDTAGAKQDESFRPLEPIKRNGKEKRLEKTPTRIPNARQIRLMREKLGYSVKEASKRIGVKSSTWYGWEDPSSQRHPPLSAAILIKLLAANIL